MNLRTGTVIFLVPIRSYYFANSLFLVFIGAKFVTLVVLRTAYIVNRSPRRQVYNAYLILGGGGGEATSKTNGKDGGS